MTIRRTSLSLFISIFVALVLFVPAASAERKAKAKAVDKPAAPAEICKAHLLMDALSGEVIDEKNSHEPLAPASMIKLMVAYTAMKKVQDGTVNLSDVITASARASKVGGSQVYLKQGEQFTLDQLLDAVLIQSANDAAYAISEHIGGSAAGYVEIMNVYAQELGLSDSTFASPHGLPPGDGQTADLMSATDLAKLARAIIKEFPELLQRTGKIEAPFRDGSFIMRNHNKLVVHFAGCDGLKTGYYAQAGFGVTATATRSGSRMIAVLMGCENRLKRDDEASRLLSMGFAQFKSVKLIGKGGAAAQTIAVKSGAKAVIAPVAAQDAFGTVRPADKDKITQRPMLCSNLEAPVKAGTPCGTISFFVGDREVGKVAAIIPEDIPLGSLVQRYWPAWQK